LQLTSGWVVRKGVIDLTRWKGGQGTRKREKNVSKWQRGSDCGVGDQYQEGPGAVGIPRGAATRVLSPNKWGAKNEQVVQMKGGRSKKPE